MKSKNISVNIKKTEIIPYKETYIVIQETKKTIKFVQKFKTQTENQVITLDYNECERLMNLLHYYVFKGKYQYKKDKVLIIRE